MIKCTLGIAVALLVAGCMSSDIDVSWTRVPQWQMINGGEFIFGNSDGLANEGPEVVLVVDSFYLSETEVTNRQFELFVNEAGYLTDAERKGGGTVFIDGWKIIEGADWRHPMGAGSSIDTIMDHPVVMVSYNDALSYCKWIGGRLPTEVEWEYAAKKGQSLLMRKNIWRGEFPDENIDLDGYLWTGSVNAYGADSLGLYQMLGNVWEWCIDSYSYEVHDKWAFKKDSLPKVFLGGSFDPVKPEEDDTLRVIKGGSFMCHGSTCEGYIPDARQSAVQGEAFFHVGFRVAKNIE